MGKVQEISQGLSNTIEEVVTKDKCADQIGSGELEIYSTPSMIALMEKASLMCVQMFLSDGESTVGGAVNIKHLKPTSLGKKVMCKSWIHEVKGKKIDFDVEVYEGSVLIGVGKHTRFIIHKSSFLTSLRL